MSKNNKIAYIINHSTFFASHILPHALQAKKSGYDVKLFCGKYLSKSMNSHGMSLIKKFNIEMISFNFSSTSLNLFKEFFAFVKLYKNLQEYKPDLLHVATPKGQLYGGLLSIILGVKCLVVFISGMGYLFSNNLSFFEKFVRHIFILFQKLIFSHQNKIIIVENRDDLKYFKNKFKIISKNISLINGSGVDMTIFKKSKRRNNNKMVLFVGRILKEKGIIEYIKAAEILKKIYPDWKFVVAGATDYLKTSKIDKKILKKYNKKKIVDFLNYKKNMINIYNKASIVCLPSYREGLPKSLCEAAACGLPIVTTNVIGCKSAIIPNKTGVLCLPGNVKSLKNKIEFLILNQKLRILYGNNGLKLAAKRYNINIISNQILSIYKGLLSEKK